MQSKNLKTVNLGLRFVYCWFVKMINQVCCRRDGPLYLEWAPGNILSRTSTVDDDKVVGELEVQRALLKQQVEDPTEADVDPDRIEVIFLSECFSKCLSRHPMYQSTAVAKFTTELVNAFLFFQMAHLKSVFLHSLTQHYAFLNQERVSININNKISDSIKIKAFLDLRMIRRQSGEVILVRIFMSHVGWIMWGSCLGMYNGCVLRV